MHNSQGFIQSTLQNKQKKKRSQDFFDFLFII